MYRVSILYDLCPLTTLIQRRPQTLARVRVGSFLTDCTDFDSRALSALNDVKRTGRLLVNHARNRSLDWATSPYSIGSLIWSSSFKPTKLKLLQQLDILDPRVLHYDWRIKAFSSNTANCILTMRDPAGLSDLSLGDKFCSKSLSPRSIATDNKFVQDGSCSSKVWGNEINKGRQSWIESRYIDLFPSIFPMRWDKNVEGIAIACTCLY